MAAPTCPRAPDVSARETATTGTLKGTSACHRNASLGSSQRSRSSRQRAAVRRRLPRRKARSQELHLPDPPARPTADGGNLAAEQILNVDIAGEPPTLDPNKAQDSNSLTVLRALHRPLVYIDPETLEPVPALAESWEISEDAKTLTFTLKDAQYSNGDPIVAGDLVYGWRRLVDPRTAAPYSYVMAEVEGAAELLGMDPENPAVRRRDRRRPRKPRCRGPGRQDVHRPPRHAGDVLPQRDDAVGDGADPGGVDQVAGCLRGRQLRQLGPVPAGRRGTTTARSC